MNNKFKNLCLISMACLTSSAVVAQVNKPLDIDKMAARQMSMDEAINNVGDSLGWNWLESKKSSCNNSATFLQDKVDFKMENRTVKFSQLSHVQGITDKLYNAHFKVPGMDCTQIINSPDKEVIELVAASLWKLKTEQGDSAVQRFILHRKRQLNNAPIRDQFMEKSFNFAEGKALVDKVIQQEISRSSLAPQTFSRPTLAAVSYKAKSTSILNFGKMIGLVDIQIKPKGQGLELKWTTSSKNPYMEEGKQDTQVRGIMSSKDQEIPLVGQEMNFHDKKQWVLSGGSSKETKLEYQRSRIKQTGSAAFLPATAAKAKVAELSYFENMGILGSASAQEYRSCVAVAKDSLQLLGRNFNTVVIECAGVKENIQKPKKSEYINPDEHKVVTLAKYLIRVNVDLNTGLPLQAEMNYEHVMNGNGSRVSTLFQVTQL